MEGVLKTRTNLGIRLPDNAAGSWILDVDDGEAILALRGVGIAGLQLD